jgi:hypothetical protein
LEEGELGKARNTTETTVTHVKQMLLMAETEHQLRSHNLVEFLEFKDDIEELIGQLYYQLGEKALAADG